MKIIVLGGGAIGSLYGAKLSKLNDVIIVARKKHADAINKHGLRITGAENRTYKLRAAEKVDRIENGTIIILSTKVHDTEDAIRPIKKLLKKDTIILCLQNGYGTEEFAKKIVGNKCLVLRCVIAVGTSFLEPGKISSTKIGYTAIEKSPKSAEIAENFAKCETNAYVADDIKEVMWSKLFMNCVLNPISAVLKIRNDETMHPSLKPLRDGVIRECVRVANKDGFDFTIKDVEAIVDRLRKSNNYSSMYQDLMKGKKTEIEFLNGAVVKLGKKYGVDCPVNESLVAMVTYLESKK